MANLRFGCLMDTSPTSSNILQRGIVKTAHRHSILSWNPASSSEERMMSEFRAPPHTHVRFFLCGSRDALRPRSDDNVPPASQIPGTAGRTRKPILSWLVCRRSHPLLFIYVALTAQHVHSCISISISRLSPPPFCTAPILIQCILEIAAN